ncbi:DUF2786 domain-containing protein [Streptomyces sp. CA-253872]|uniref:DUF2786 domain-containing protein n=1 Tax=Streptomyces sp. CA-253872 TaxID=3240067 RepID=UPI003D93430B
MPRETGRTHRNARDTPSGEPPHGDPRAGTRPDPVRAAGDALGAALGDDSDRALDAAASLIAALPPSTAHALLTERGTALIGAAWRRGWEPADLARLVRRALRPAHSLRYAALVREETRRYALLAPRWKAQLADLEAGNAAHARGAGSAGDGIRGDRFGAAVASVELYRLLFRVPAIEPVGPPPGTAPSVPLRTGDRELTRIRALLAKAEATAYPAEAEALSAKAQELMTRHRVDSARLAGVPAGPGEGVAACRIGVEPPYGEAQAILLDAVARASGCRAVWNEEHGFSTVVGDAGDLAAVELLHTSLLVQAQSALTRAEAQARAAGRRRTKTFRQSFLLAYAEHIGARLEETAESTVTESAEPEVLPVLAARDVAVTEATERMFPKTKAARVRGVSDEAGWLRGREAASCARLGVLPGELPRDSRSPRSRGPRPGGPGEGA